MPGLPRRLPTLDEMLPWFGMLYPLTSNVASASDVMAAAMTARCAMVRVRFMVVDTGSVGVETTEDWRDGDEDGEAQRGCGVRTSGGFFGRSSLGSREAKWGMSCQERLFLGQSLAQRRSVALETFTQKRSGLSLHLLHYRSQGAAVWMSATLHLSDLTTSSQTNRDFTLKHGE